MCELLNDESKFKQLTSDPKKLREDQLQRYLRKLNEKDILTRVFMLIFTQHVLFPQDYTVHPKFIRLRTISYVYCMSSINSYNYNLASYLCELLTPFIPTAYSTKTRLP